MSATAPWTPSSCYEFVVLGFAGAIELSLCQICHRRQRPAAGAPIACLAIRGPSRGCSPRVFVDVQSPAMFGFLNVSFQTHREEKEISRFSKHRYLSFPCWYAFPFFSRGGGGGSFKINQATKKTPSCSEGHWMIVKLP